MRINTPKTQASLLLVITVLFILSAGVSFAQESQQSPPVLESEKPTGPRTDLLTMNGGKPALSATGEGITSYKTDDIYKRGTTRVRLVKPADLPFKIELPIGYTIFNNLIYAIESDVTATGPSDITFHLPSASTKEVFAELRILHPEQDFADPEAPRWADVTLDRTLTRLQPLLSDAAIKERQRDFKSRTLHAYTEDAPVFLIVASRDPAKLREKLTADLELTGTASPQVTEGRSATFELKITNRGPDTATGIVLHALPSFTFVSVETSHGKCRMSGQNVYCKVSSLEKDRSVDVKIVERCEWGRDPRPSPTPEAEPSIGLVSKFVTVGASEQDPATENNQLYLETQVFPDPNKGPVLEVLSPKLFEIFQGPGASVPIRFKATDPDGFIKKLELFDRNGGQMLGQPTPQSEGEYELVYKEVPFGRQRVRIVATDNLGRVATLDVPEFFVNGTSKVEIVSPKAGSMLNRADGELTITIHASDASARLKKVSLDVWGSDATPVGNDNYVVKLKFCGRKCRLQAVAIDENGVETRSEYVEFTIASSPITKLYWYDGEYLHDFEPGKALKVSDELMLLASAQHENNAYVADIKKIEYFIDGELVCTVNEPERVISMTVCAWRATPGKYKLHAVATDVDGAVGKSEVIEVSIERP